MKRSHVASGHELIGLSDNTTWWMMVRGENWRVYCLASMEQLSLSRTRVRLWRRDSQRRECHQQHDQQQLYQQHQRSMIQRQDRPDSRQAEPRRRWIACHRTTAIPPITSRSARLPLYLHVSVCRCVSDTTGSSSESPILNCHGRRDMIWARHRLYYSPVRENGRVVFCRRLIKRRNGRSLTWNSVWKSYCEREVWQ